MNKYTEKQLEFALSILSSRIEVERLDFDDTQMLYDYQLVSAFSGGEGRPSDFIIRLKAERIFYDLLTHKAKII